jgi:hypothetical protein
MPDVDIRERKYLSQFTTDSIGLGIYRDGAPTDADAGVTVSLLREDINDYVFQDATATDVGTGLYEIALTSAQSSIPGNYTAIWNFLFGGIPQEVHTYLVVGNSSPNYDALSPEFKDIVDGVWVRFADLFDSPDGGPNLQTYFQTNYNRNRVAQLLRIAVGILNTRAQPYQTYTIDGDGGSVFPFDKWGPLAEEALYVECLKHLCRSYVEQPNLVGPQVSRLDRRDYLDRWRLILQDEQLLLKEQLDVFKIAHMGFGRPHVLVSGGVYGRFAPTRVAGSMAARPRYWSRFYA